MASPCKRWTKEDDKRLIELCNTGLSNTDMSKLLCRTLFAVNNRMSILRIFNRGVRTTYKIWTTTEKNNVIRMRKAEISMERIAIKLKRTVKSVQSMCFKLGVRTRPTLHLTKKTREYLRNTGNKIPAIGTPEYRSWKEGLRT